MKNHIRMGRMSGLSLVELLVAATISTLLLTAAISIFLASKESFNVSEDISRVQENIRYASGRIFRDVSTAGYMGCAPFVSSNRSSVPGMTAGSLGDFSQAIIGGESVGPNNSDSLTLHFARIDTAVPYNDSTGAYSGGNTGFYANAASAEYQDNDIVVMSDCSNAMIVQLTATPSGGTLQHSGEPASQSDALLGNETPAFIYKMDGVTYQLQTSAADSDNKYVSRLMATRLDNMANPQTVLDGVEDFQVEYGVDANNDHVAERYINWDQVVAGGHEQRLISVRISLVVNSGKPQKNILGQVTDAEKNMVKSSTFTIALRNFGGAVNNVKL